MCVVSHIHQYFIPSNGYVASLVAQSVKNLPENRRPGFDSWVEKIPWRRKWQPTPVFLPGESHGQRSLAGYSPWSCQSQTRFSDQTTNGYVIFHSMCITQFVHSSLGGHFEPFPPFGYCE